MIWLAILGAGVGCYLLKVAGMSVPAAWLEKPLLQRIADLMPVALLAALIAVQVFAGPERTLALDARAAGLVVAVVALLLRAPFLVVVLAAAAAAALLRLAGVG